MTEEEKLEGIVKKLYAIFITDVLPPIKTTKKERKLLFEFASFVDNVIEGKPNEQKES